MRDFVPLLVEELAKYENRLDSEKAINDVFADFYVDQNQKILDEEYTFIIRNITTPSLRAYFDKLANKHNRLLSDEGAKRLALNLNYPIILSTTEQKNYHQSIQDFKEGKGKHFDIFAHNVLEPRTIEWIRTEMDSDWHYKGPDKNIREDVWNPEQLVCKYVDPTNLAIRVGRSKAKYTGDFKHCCVCQEFNRNTWCYVIDNVHYYVCSDCMNKHYLPNPSLTRYFLTYFNIVFQFADKLYV